MNDSNYNYYEHYMNHTQKQDLDTNGNLFVRSLVNTILSTLEYNY